MPNNHSSPSTEFFKRLNNIEKRLASLEHQQNTTVANQKGQPILNIGQIPPIGAQSQKTPLYGFQMLNPGTGNVGTPVLQLGQQADGTYGLEIFDSSGNLKVSLGEIPGDTSNYGLAVYDSTQIAHLVNPPIELYTTTTTTITTTSSVQLSGQNYNPLTFQTGPSGRFSFSISSEIALNPIANSTIGVQVYLLYSINGGPNQMSRVAVLQLSTGSSATGILANVSAQDYVSTGTPNATITASLYAQGTYMPSGGTGYVYGAFSTIIVY